MSIFHVSSVLFNGMANSRTPVMLNPQGQSGLQAKILALTSASKLWPRSWPQTCGLGLASISLSYYVIGHFFGQKSCKIREFCLNFQAIILNRFVRC